jgi:hypothetical protein
MMAPRKSCRARGRGAARCYGESSQESSFSNDSISLSQRDRLQLFGAGEGIRTLDVNLGNRGQSRFPPLRWFKNIDKSDDWRYPDDPAVTPKWCSRWCSKAWSTTYPIRVRAAGSNPPRRCRSRHPSFRRPRAAGLGLADRTARTRLARPVDLSRSPATATAGRARSTTTDRGSGWRPARTPGRSSRKKTHTRVPTPLVLPASHIPIRLGHEMKCARQPEASAGSRLLHGEERLGRVPCECNPVGVLDQC